jgi:hypothetical protein
VTHHRPFAPAFQRAFVATRYFLGAREEGLAAPLGDAAAARAVEETLRHPERERRAEALATEVAHVVRALEARRYR